MKDASGLPITEGFYTDSQIFHYYHIKETPEGLMKKESSEKNYSPLDSLLAPNLNRIIRQEELVNLILSVETGMDKSEKEDLEFFREIQTGILGKMSKSNSK